MNWTALNVVMLITTFAAAEEGGADDTKQPDGIINEFATNYGEILKELQACGVPSKNMFVRPVLKDGTPQGSDFDRFCYFEAKENQMSLFLCRNYKSVVDTYYGQYCQDPDRAPLDTSVQYLLFAQTPSETCKTLLATVVYGTESGTQLLFTSTESCEETCHQSLFCTNLAYLLSIRQLNNMPPDFDMHLQPVLNEPQGGYSAGYKEEVNNMLPDFDMQVQPFLNEPQGGYPAGYNEEGGYREMDVAEEAVNGWSEDDETDGLEMGFDEVEISETSFEESKDGNNYNPCQNFFCYNGGTCVESYSSQANSRFAYCSCPGGLYGTHCEYGTLEKEGPEPPAPWTLIEEEEPRRGHFFLFLVVSIVLIIFVYIVYHNKTKIKEYFGDLQAERKAKKNTKTVNYNVYVRLQ